MKRLVVAAAALWLVLPNAAAQDARPALREGAEHAVPLYGDLLAPYDAPEDPFAPGHRGVDVGAEVSSPVRASAAGVVSFAGSVAGNLAVSVDHGDGLLTTYSFLERIAVSKGQEIGRGDVVGALGTGHDPDLPPHVHLSARRHGVYFDPIELYLGVAYADLLRLVG